MQKVKVIRIVPVNGSAVFEVRTVSDNKLHGCFTFELNAVDNNSYNEEKNRLKAMALAAKIENGNKGTEEIIYQTESN